MEDEKIKVLLIEDNPGDARLIREALSEIKGSPFDLRYADRLSSGLERLMEDGTDVVLLDLSLPDSQGLDTFTRIHAKAQGVPVLVLTGFDDETLAVKAVREGAQDYLVKGQVDGNLLGRAIRYAIERKRAEEALRLSGERFNKAFNANPGPMLIVSLAEGKFLDINNSFLYATGYQREEVVGRIMNELDIWADPEDYVRVKRMLQESGSVHNFEFSFCMKSGEVRVGLLSAEIIDLSGEKCVLAIFNDITERKRAEEILHRLSYIDGLTSIANRRHFDEVLNSELRRAVRDVRPLSLIMLDIDFFKAYNDTYGHLKGDDCLKQIACVVSSFLKRPGDLAARYGGEEFAVILPNTGAEGTALVAENLRAKVEDLKIPHTGSRVSDYVTVSLGVVTMIPGRDSTPGALIAAADSALYQAKLEGRNRIKMSSTL